MRRSRATSWALALLVLAMSALGAARDFHAASHARAVATASLVCDHADAAAPAETQVPADHAPTPVDDCATCDLLAVLAKGVTLPAAPVAVEHAVLVRTVDAPSAADPAVDAYITVNRTRGPPAALSRAV